VSVLLMACWLPASSHALLEHYELIHHVHADHDATSDGSHEHGTNNHEPADGNCALSSARVSYSAPGMLEVPVPLFLLAAVFTCDLHGGSSSSDLAPPGAAPPQFSQSWQFSSRAALPARAPSFVS